MKKLIFSIFILGQCLTFQANAASLASTETTDAQATDAEASNAQASDASSKKNQLIYVLNLSSFNLTVYHGPKRPRLSPARLFSLSTRQEIARGDMKVIPTEHSEGNILFYRHSLKNATLACKKVIALTKKAVAYGTASCAIVANSSLVGATGSLAVGAQAAYKDMQESANDLVDCYGFAREDFNVEKLCFIIKDHRASHDEEEAYTIAVTSVSLDELADTYRDFLANAPTTILALEDQEESQATASEQKAGKEEE